MNGKQIINKCKPPTVKQVVDQDYIFIFTNHSTLTMNLIRPRNKEIGHWEKNMADNVYVQTSINSQCDSIFSTSRYYYEGGEVKLSRGETKNLRRFVENSVDTLRTRNPLCSPQCCHPPGLAG